jgi:hypothetical protein
MDRFYYRQCGKIRAFFVQHFSHKYQPYWPLKQGERNASNQPESSGLSEQ